MAYSSYLVHGCFFKGTFYKKREFRLLKPHKLMQFLIVRNGNIFFNFQGSRLNAIVACSKVQLQTLQKRKDVFIIFLYSKRKVF